MSPYAILAIPASLIGAAVVLAVIRAKRKTCRLSSAPYSVGRVTMTTGTAPHHCPRHECAKAPAWSTGGLG